MAELSPSVAAQLAAAVYAVQDENGGRKFLSRSEFSTKAGDGKQLKATVGFRLINAQDGFGICACGGQGYENDLFIIFRGSTTANHCADFASNGRIGVEFSQTGLPVHIGFNQVFNSMLPQIKEFLGSQLQVTGVIHCIGHSLGGAVATLAANWIKGNRVNEVKLYTFGAPRAGLSRFAKRLTANLTANNIHRVYHATDPVPMIPIFPFVHAPLPGLGHYIPSSEMIVSAEAHGMGKYILSVNTLSWNDLERRPPPYTVESAIEQWLQSKIPVNPADPKMWDWINAALVYVLKKYLTGLFVALETGLTGVFTIADKIAWILNKGIDLSKEASAAVHNLMRKIMQALGMAIVKTAKELTQALLRSVLLSLMHKLSDEAQRAVRQIFRV